MTILLLADSNAATYACTLLANELSHQGLECLVVATQIGIENSPLPAIPPGLGRVPQLQFSLKELLLSSLIHRAKAVGAFLHASKIGPFVQGYRQICQLHGQSPAPVFSGPVFPLGGDTLIADLLPRLCCDLLCLHGQRQLEEARDLMHRWPDPVPTVALGFWFMPEAPEDGGLVGAGTPQPPHTLVVLTQAGLPNLPGARARMLRLLGEKASASPHWRVLIQPDHSLPTGRLPLDAETSDKKKLPPNLSFAAAANLPLILGRCSACLSLSSPWIFTAMAWGRPVLVMGDHGITTNQGSAPFFGSGVMGRLDALADLDELLERPRANWGWLERMGWGVHDGATQLACALQAMAEAEAPLP